MDGKVVDPLLYEGSIYLPLRAIGEMMGMNVEWDATDGTVFLSGEVTDYDTNYSTGGNTGTTTGAAISMSRAREIALANAGLTADDVVFVECELGRDNGRLGVRDRVHSAARVRPTRSMTTRSTPYRRNREH